ncbi:glutaminase A [Agromyces atrinae]|uniref:Glutaminase n=1 Tax=Agromyces atrinae TaxID=592376 RepID=A0A4Q2M025_9MICO|nr:glutaminase A [Agromyces atrinae]NYD65566.1 glutaminase [Agromyces atrinae]RXZ85038.1 glutaminase A [Agromyces atrinae]
MTVDLRDPIRLALARVVEEGRKLEGGDVASYIPELARADPDALGVAIASVRGTIHETGDSDTEFTIQSVSKPFVLALALEQAGLTEVTRHVGLEPSGEPFNAISLDEATGRPFNPMINAGAIVTSSLIDGDSAAEKFAVIRRGLEAFAGRQLDVDDAVFESELESGDRNRALAYLARSAGTLASSVDVATEAYFRQCALLVSARDIAVMAATLAAGGRNPVTGERVVSEAVARWTTAVMSSCGMYDASGAWMVRVGLPAKSGVGGGVAALLPDQFGIGTFSPPLDAQGNSARGVAMLEALSNEYGLHLLMHRGEPLSPISTLDTDRDPIVARLRGELVFSGAEEVLTRLDTLARDGVAIEMDLEGVTRLGPAARLLFRDALKEASASGHDLTVNDPDGLLDEAN